MWIAALSESSGTFVSPVSTKTHAFKLVDTFVDYGVSGSREKRPALDRMMTDAKKGKFDAVLVWRSDRLFRSLRHRSILWPSWT